MNFINENTFLLTGLLLNYDISEHISIKKNNTKLQQTHDIIEELLVMIIEDQKYPKEILINKFLNTLNG